MSCAAIHSATAKLPESAYECDAQRATVQAHNEHMAGLSAAARVAWAVERLPQRVVMSSSFGAQSAVSLHLITAVLPDIPVILIDTGYLFPETYRFIDELTDRLALNLKVYRPTLSAAWQEARFGKRWEQQLDGIDAYNQDNKVEPMARALRELDVGTWFAGLRRVQATTRAQTPFLLKSGQRWKVHPIADWGDRDVYHYLKKHDLPYHPLWERGFVSIGDVHTTRSVNDVTEFADTRFFGLKRECGIHDIELSSL